MFDVPGFNPSGMSDEELLNRQAELSRRLGWAARFSGSDMSTQLWAMINSIEAERRDRVLKVMFDQRNKMFPDIIESEPDLAAEHKRKVVTDDTDQRMANRRRVGRERLALTKTSSPAATQPAFTLPPERTPEPEVVIERTDKPTDDVELDVIAKQKPIKPSKQKKK